MPSFQLTVAVRAQNADLILYDIYSHILSASSVA
jgi:hypothetical protein